jgi:hypothetical protein
MQPRVSQVERERKLKEEREELERKLIEQEAKV